MKILIIDNYDSFTYNLVQYLKETIEATVDVFRNDQIALEEIEKYDAIVLSPGPGLPKDAGITLDIIREYSGRKAILGICLGHQAIAEAFGDSRGDREMLHAAEVSHWRPFRLNEHE